MIQIYNTSIMTGGVGVYRLSAVASLDEAKSRLVTEGFQSAIGHEATAAVLTELLGVAVSVNRIFAKQQPGATALVFKLNGRIPEGSILSREEIDKIGYELFWMEFEPTVTVELGLLWNCHNTGDGWTSIDFGMPARLPLGDPDRFLEAAEKAREVAAEQVDGMASQLFLDGRPSTLFDPSTEPNAVEAKTMVGQRFEASEIPGAMKRLGHHRVTAKALGERGHGRSSCPEGTEVEWLTTGPVGEHEFGAYERFVVVAEFCACGADEREGEAKEAEGARGEQ